ncbi:hypothetical protein VTO73DRAFT_10361 [Trametes versicolor]
MNHPGFDHLRLSTSPPDSPRAYAALRDETAQGEPEGRVSLASSYDNSAEWTAQLSEPTTFYTLLEPRRPNIIQTVAQIWTRHRVNGCCGVRWATCPPILSESPCEPEAFLTFSELRTRENGKATV